MPRLPRPGSSRPGRALREFLQTEAAGGVVLLVAAAVALVWANSPWQDTYRDLWTTDASFGIGDASLHLDLRGWVNDGLMTIFFFVVGLEIKRELVQGELRDPRRAALPVFAAAGGMVVPALVYVAFNAGGVGERGWGIPMATDIAIAVGVLSLLGARVAPSLKLFLLALAIVDDIGAIVVIAAFYTGGIDVLALAVGFGFFAVAVVMHVAGVRIVALYVAAGIALWLAVHESGVHATLVGVALGLLAPARPFRGDVPGDPTVVERLEHALHPWSSFVVLPLFALANAGVPLSTSAVERAVSSPIAWGVIVGLVVGKPVGILAFTWVAHRLRVATLPRGGSWPAIAGVAALGGIGFTVSLFVTSLAFDRQVLQDEAKIAILTASLVAAVVGALILRLTHPSRVSASAGDT